MLIRPLFPADTESIVSLYARAMQREANIGPVSRDQWERFVRSPQNQHGRDFRVAEIDGTVIGLAESSVKEQIEGRVRYVKIVVDPACRRRGIATNLLRTVTGLDIVDAGVTLHGQTREGWEAGEAFLAAMGFQYLESDFTMICPKLLPIGERPQDRVRFVRAADSMAHAAEVARIHNAAFSSDVAFRKFTTEEMAEDLRNEGDDLWLALEGDQAIGFCRIEADQAGPWLESIALQPAAQGRGIGTRFAYHVLATYGISPERPAGLSVSSSNPNAQSVYTRLGFSQRAEKRRYAGKALAIRERLDQRPRPAI